jgi:CheY-like chemotaxis protein
MAAKILLIDDDRDDREIFCEALERVSVETVCYTSPNGPNAFERLDKNEIELPNLIFLDINMSVMSGWECLKRLKANEKYHSIPVIMYSTSSYPEDIQKSQNLGALCFFTKPFEFNDLIQGLEAAVDHLHKNTLHLLKLNTLFA